MATKPCGTYCIEEDKKHRNNLALNIKKLNDEVEFKY